MRHLGHVRWGILAAMMMVGPALGMGAAPQSAAQPSPVPTQPATQRAWRVVVSLPPLKTVAQRLSPPGATVEVLVPAGVSEHGYELPPGVLSRLDEADVVVMVGAGMEPQVDRVLRSHPRANRKVVTFATIAGVAGACDNADQDSGHEHNHEHGSAESDPHVWLSPPLMLRLVDAVEATLAGAMQERGEPADSRESLARRAAALRDEIRGVDARYRATLATAPRRVIITGHDAFGRLAEAYGLRVVALTGLSAGEPTMAAMREAAKVVREQGLTTLFVEPQLSPRAALRVAEVTGAKVDTLDPLGSGDWFELMEGNLRVLAKALGGTLPVDPAAGERK